MPTASPANASGGAGPPIDCVQLSNGTINVDRQVAALGDPNNWGNFATIGPPSDGLAPSQLLATAGMRFNGATWDRHYNANQQLQLLASAARTATTSSANQVNPNWAGIAVALWVTSVPGAAPSLQVSLAVAAAGGTLAPFTAAVTTTGYFVYLYAPGASGTPFGSSPGVVQQFATALPGGLFAATVTHGNANSVTYSLAAFPIVFS